MWRPVCVLVVVVAGCWSDDPQVNGFTTDQWLQLEHDFALPFVDRCVLPSVGGKVPAARCDALAHLGQELFWEPALSGTGTVSCVTCHDANKWFIDSRTPNNLSFGTAKWTGRNSMPVVDLGLKYDLAPVPKQAFTWNGKFGSPGAVLELAITKPMGSSHAIVAGVIRNNPQYGMEYGALFGNPSQMTDDTIFENLEMAFDAYFRELSSLPAPFDLWITGQTDAISDSAKRGFNVFVGRGTCIECHKKAAFTDFAFHDTGVPQTGENVPAIDLGRGDVTKDPADDGKFLTATLRNVARTAPYMHDGALSSLTDVVEFYRHGGGASGYSGTKDPRIDGIDITDDDARDLVAFLQTLDGADIDPSLREDIRPGGASTCGQLTSCSGACVNLQSNSMNCGACGLACASMLTCVMGHCAPNPCPVPLSQCATGCMDLQNDPMNCGSCGQVCSYPTTCRMGVCG